jgi:hypothetical protein
MQIHKHGDTYVIEWADGSYTVVNEDSIDDSDLELVDILEQISHSEDPS